MSEVNATQFESEVNRFAKAVSECAHEHGWWPKQGRNMGEMIALMHSELSEALEAWRDHDIPTEIRYAYKKPDGTEIVLYNPRFVTTEGKTELGKPVGVASEFADVIIRILDTCHTLNIPIAQALLEKHKYNLTRPYRHGGKLA